MTATMNYIDKGKQAVPLLKVEDLHAGYGKRPVLHGVEFDVGRSEIVLMTGGNGSGKSTVLKCIYGLLKPEKGRILFEGNDITNHKSSDMIKKQILYIPQKNNYFENLSVNNNLEVAGNTIEDKVILKQRMTEVYEITGLGRHRKSTPFTLSGGERQLLAFGMALIPKPKLVLFDEPFAGMDKDNSEVLLKTILKLKKDGIAFLVVEHEKHLTNYANKVNEIELGKIKNKLFQNSR
ncbi:MAG: hypothetical protein A2475_01245 [Ignavibacteria bacterium RIFOXYC2_FULL_35_21]|nr:MAG: hypothetical protein A2220_01800 [Ignavibacteria bacterium RIFOXYA2_FULL_35_10]OGV21269.1 MAG: hypothetical protein A2475_01245 [Ignavibacteria bacterium RIFOXYC2_FULL_35_21]